MGQGQCVGVVDIEVINDDGIIWGGDEGYRLVSKVFSNCEGVSRRVREGKEEVGEKVVVWGCMIFKLVGILI